MLQGAQNIASKRGIDLDVGEFPESSLFTSDGDGQGDPERPVRILAHAVARGADRLKFMRKLSRHMEGMEAKAGLASDILAVGWDLAQRNSDAIEQFAREYVQGVLAKGRERKAAQAATQTKQTGV